MTVPTISAPILDVEERFEAFENLMPFRVQNILLVSSLYDSFILREDGRLNELLIDESLEMNLRQIPNITHVSSCAEALELAKSNPQFNLIVTNLAVGDMNAAQLARDVRRAGLDVPVVVLGYDYREIKDFVARNPATDIDRVFLWQGTARILIAIVKYVEDKRNVLHDTRAMGVPVLLVVEDNIRYYSSFLPVIYTELIKQSRRVIQEGINVAHKLVRMQARPKILLSSNFEEAAELVQQYREYIFGVVSDVEFPWEGKLSPEAGFELARMVRSLTPDVPVVLQTSRTEFRPRAQAQGYSFLRKRSPTLLKDLRRILTDQFGFGDFVFRMPDQGEVGRAKDLTELEEMLQTVPADSLMFHAQRNHFSHWLMARTEFALAAKLRPRRVSDFNGPEHLRHDLIESINDYRREQNEVLIGDFKADTFKPSQSSFLRIGSGSLGGKARGLAFVRHLLRTRRITKRFPGVRITVPPAVVIATDMFDQFLAENNLGDFALHCDDDNEIQQRFLDSPLPAPLIENLEAFLEEVRYPLAVRSSSLLEDSQYQPFTGVYETFMLGNQQGGSRARLDELVGGDQARLRLHLQPACEIVRSRDAVSSGRREDGGDPAAGGRNAARTALLSGFLRSGPLAQFLSRAAHEFRRWHRGGGPGPGTHGSGWRQVPDVLPALSQEPAAVFFGRRYSRQHANRVLRSRTRCRSSCGRAGSPARSALRPRCRRERWNAARGRLHLFRRQSSRLRRAKPSRRPRRDVRAHAEAWHVSSGADS